MLKLKKGDALQRTDGSLWEVITVHPPYITARRKRSQGYTLLPRGGGRGVTIREEHLEEEGFTPVDITE
jgi:hypothetical protein